MKYFQKSSIKISIYFTFSALVLFLGFFLNFWKVANEQWFLSQNYDMESYIIGRLVKSQQNGVFSSGGLTGLGSPDFVFAEPNNNSFEFQYKAYFNNQKFGSFSPYYSQIGGQGMLFSILDELMPLVPQLKLTLFKAFTSLFTAITVAMIVLWFYYEFGLLVSLFVLVSTVLSPWLVVFGGKLWWSTWSFYLPMVAIMYHLKKRNPVGNQNLTFGIIIFTVVFIKIFITGYEYITTTLIMMMVPFIYYGVLRRMIFRKLITGFYVAIISSFLSMLLSFSILSFQIASLNGNLLSGVKHFVYSFEKRTYGDSNNFSSEYSDSLNSNASSVVITYLRGGYFGPTELLRINNPILTRFVSGISFLFLLIFFCIFSVILSHYRKKIIDIEKQRASLALISALWFSLLAPLSWFIIFKSHSFIHTHMNYIVWQMPFTIFGFAVCGLALQPFFETRLYKKFK